MNFPSLDKNLSHINVFAKLTNAHIIKDFTKDIFLYEIDKVIKDMDPFKYPGPDGFHVMFFKLR